MRTDGYLPIRDYALLADQHSGALVGRDGSIDWLCAPWFDSPWVFGALLDAEEGGRQELRPRGRFDAERRYLPSTSVLETIFSCADGSVRVTDAMPIGRTGSSIREVVRRVEGLAGEVPMEWTMAPRFAYRSRPEAVERRDDALVARGGDQAVGVRSWGAGEPRAVDGRVSSRFTLRAGDSALLVFSVSSRERHLVGERREQVEARLDHSVGHWWRWCAERTYDGPWRDEVLRSALVLKLLTFAPTGAVTAAPTTSLPESMGGSKNWDYRFSWLRDASFAVDALLRVGDDEEASRFLAWLVRATQHTHPEVQPFYRLAGTADIGQEELALDGYRGSRPVRAGNAAASQRQLGSYGDLFQTAWIYVSRGHEIEAAAGARLAEIADRVSEAWHLPDAGIWELGDHQLYTSSKMACWIALDRAVRLVAEGQLAGDRVDRWRAAGVGLAELIERRCWSDERRSYMRSADSDELDASVLLGAFMDYGAASSERLSATVDRLREELGEGPHLFRYTGMPGVEGAFCACSFWCVHAMARLGRLDEAGELMDELVGTANDVGLYSEQIDPRTGEFLGNFPQALTHLALVNAAVTLDEMTSGERPTGA